MSLDLFLVRHGLPTRVEDTPRPDPVLSDIGHQQAQDVARALADTGITDIVASTMRRAVQTAEPLARTLGLPVVQDPDLVEFELGADFYIPVEDMLAEQDERLDHWRLVASSPFGKRRRAEFDRRVVAALERILPERGSVSVFAHGGVIDTVVAAAGGVPDGPPTYGSISHLRRYGARWVCVELHAVDHLRTVIGPGPTALDGDRLS